MDGHPKQSNLMLSDAFNRLLYHADAISAYLLLTEQGWVIIDAGSGITFVKCFLKGTNILTPSGYKQIEKLRVGEPVMTHDGRKVFIKKIRRSTPSPSVNTHPYVIRAGTRIDSYQCIQDLYLTPEHAILQSGVMVPIQYTEFKQVTDQELIYYHIVLPNFYTDTLIANGIPCESLCILGDPKITSMVVRSPYRKLLTSKEYICITQPNQYLLM